MKKEEVKQRPLYNPVMMKKRQDYVPRLKNLTRW